MSETPRWSQLIKSALQRNKGPQTKWFQLATVRNDGRPACRTVVFRGWYDGKSKLPQLKFVTDRRTDKVEQIEKNPWTEICWYFQVCREMLG